MTFEDKASWRKSLSFTVEPPMLPRETIRKTKVFFHKSFRNFWSFFFGGYQKLPRSVSFNPFLCRIGNTRTHISDQFYNEFYDLLQSDLNRLKMYGGNNNMSRSAMEDAACNGSFMCFAKHIEERAKEKKNKESSQLRRREDLNSQNMNKGARPLAQKMKALDMMDAGDLEHVLDIEEALHYYSRLKSPVYLDIVDKFFMDIQSQLSVPQPSASFRPSKERLGSIRLKIR
ncbi:hypothetical protein VNO77_06343 [Canavalia gladiata]|uniref:ATP-dependent RNA helicase DDX11 n=1 Tax=Canavalia gladiata TaxID=3824 RepID=A0AAN9MC89_CANGL